MTDNYEDCINIRLYIVFVIISHFIYISKTDSDI